MFENMRRKIIIKYESDCDGWFARTTLDNNVFFAGWGDTPEKARNVVMRKVKHYLYPSEVPQPEEVEV